MSSRGQGRDALLREDYVDLTPPGSELNRGKRFEALSFSRLGRRGPKSHVSGAPNEVSAQSSSRMSAFSCNLGRLEFNIHLLIEGGGP